MQRKLWFLVLVGAVLISAAPARGNDFYVIGGSGGVGTKITSLPYTITAPGFYFLTQNLAATGDGISVTVNDVTIDLMGFTLTGPGTGINYGVRITGTSPCNVQIRNGTVTKFYEGIYAGNTSNQGHRIVNVTSTHNTNYGIYIGGGGHFIQDCYVLRNGNNGIETIGLVSNCIAEINGGKGIVGRGLITNCRAAGNDSDGIGLTSYGSIINCTSYNNQNIGIVVGSSGIPTLIDRNSAYNNSGGNYSAGYATTVWGLNAGR